MIMDSRLPWQLKMGIILFTLGLIISIFMAGIMDYYEREIGEEPESNYLTYLSIRITGNVIAIIGFIFLLLGFMEHNRVLRHPMPPPVNAPVGPPNTITMQVITCNGCKRQIPFDSNLCPYCGMT